MFALTVLLPPTQRVPEHISLKAVSASERVSSWQSSQDSRDKREGKHFQGASLPRVSCKFADISVPCL